MTLCTIYFMLWVIICTK